ncbi:MAG: hypothetical protein DHS20C13_28280 [Thermodesulfobacteriota bacterium]|nr:MAG: hypothetical protein DHS20C13_28280 [Thermodesulfobacteriota bacterium]
MRRIKIIGIALFISNLCLAQLSVDEIVANRIQERNIPGFAYIVSKNGDILEEGYFGLSNVELNTPVTEKSVFAIASMSKAYTAAAILLLAEEKKLDLKDSVRKYIPEVPESWNDITIKQLLTHSSGLVDDWGLYSWDKSNQLFLNSQSDSLILNHLFETELLFEPGTDVKYSCGPFVLGVVIERITGQYYEEYLKKSIFESLNLKETYVDHPYKIIPNRVSGYFNYDTTEINAGVSGRGNGILMAPVAYGRADVGIRTTARDLLKFYNALLTGQLLNENSRNVMFTSPTLNNGDHVCTAPGWMIWPMAGNLVAEHSGGFRTGFNSHVFMIPKDNFIIIILTNFQKALSFSLTQRIAGNFYPELSPHSTRSFAKDNKPKVTAQHLDFFQNIESDTLNKTLLNANYPKSYLSKTLKKSIASVKSIAFIEESDLSSKNVELFGVRIHKIRYYKLITSKEIYTVVSLDKDGKIVFIDHPE